ncbi:HpcH/HpaI aldolase family protein [Streptomyces cavernae]|uniref:HpcH/HpaI aldolase family protein n=1 Tax=Streptomyces cavernae TaxID=2259034 RepID=UPI000FEBDCD7|nr:aldolase/citrate lyase family protein [Streptomyces cavernae]
MTRSTTHPLLSRENRLTSPGVRASAPAYGIFLLTGNTMLAELCGTVPLDWVVLDMEASPMHGQDALGMMQALTGSGCAAVVRVPHLDHHLIEHALDLGATGVMVPKVNTVQAAKAASTACRFPPEGARGINPVRASGYFADVQGYLEQANRVVRCIVQIESPEAVDNVEAIAAVPGVDALFMGMGDLACGYGQPGVVTGPVMDKARAAVLTAARTHGKQAGIFAYSLDLARQYAGEGFELICVGNEVKILRDAILSALTAVHSGSAVDR